MTLYLVRHAQSMPKRSLAFSEWPLSPVGVRQAEELAVLLAGLRITQLFSSPFTRSLQTAQPFARQQGMPTIVLDNLRERLIMTDGGPPSDNLWRRSWLDFGYCPGGCESSLAAQSRITKAIQNLVARTEGTIAIFTHGNVIGLFLNSLQATFGREQTEALTNPDVLKILVKDGAFIWDDSFKLAGLQAIATHHDETPKELLDRAVPSR